jgi:hypothetical protein
MTSSLAKVTSAHARDVTSAETSHSGSAEAAHVTATEATHVTAAEATHVTTATAAHMATATAAPVSATAASTTASLRTRRQQRRGEHGGCQYLHRSSSHSFSFRRPEPLVIIESLAQTRDGRPTSDCYWRSITIR